jgi:hypothetical protein
MTDEPQMDDPIEDPELDAEEAHDEPFDDDMDFDGEDLDTEEVLMAAGLDRMHRQAYWHGTSKQLFTFLFANCLFFAGCLVAWTRAAPGENGDPSTYITGLHTIRGAFIFALSIYGFWTAVFNLYSGQMKVWPYVLNSVLALWVGVAGFAHGIGGEAWKKAGEYLDSLESKMVLDDITVRLSVIAPGCWLLTLGGVLVLWLILSGIMKGAQQSKAGEPAEAGGSSRRRR